MALSEVLGKEIYASTDVLFDCGGRGNLDLSIVSIGMLVLQILVVLFDLDIQQSQEPQEGSSSSEQRLRTPKNSFLGERQDKRRDIQGCDFILP